MSKRRPNGDGTIRKRPDGRWEARIIVGHKENKKPIYKSVFGLTQAEAMAKFRKLQEVYGAFKRILKKEGLPDIPFHSLRHTYATNSTSAGIDEKTLAKNLGHKKAAFTYNQYTHVTEYMQKHASDITGDALESILGKELRPWEDEKTDKD